MIPRTRATIALLAVAALALPATGLAALKLRTSRNGESARISLTRPSHGTSRVGALYTDARTAKHRCTASVVDSPHGDTLITAAHCVSGTGAGMAFVPGQDRARAPHGRWTVTAAHLASRWVTRQDPYDDVAFLTVAPRMIDGVSTEIQQVTGGYRLGTTAEHGQGVTVVGYPAGTTNDPITCQARIYLTGTFPSINCSGFVSGTSGSPWVRSSAHGLEIVGVIGGLHQGGCIASTSYSSPLAHGAHHAYRRAVAHTVPADVAPRPGGGGC